MGKLHLSHTVPPSSSSHTLWLHHYGVCEPAVQWCSGAPVSWPGYENMAETLSRLWGFSPNPLIVAFSLCTAIFRFCFTFAFMLSCQLPKVCVRAELDRALYPGAVVEHHLADITTAFLESQWHPFTIMFPFRCDHSPLSQFNHCLVQFRRAWRFKCVAITMTTGEMYL